MNSLPSPCYGSSDPASPSTTYVQADPSTFRAVVQKLTGAPDDPSSQKLPITLPARYSNPKPAEMGPRRPAFKLHERRQATKKLELINLTNTSGNIPSTMFSSSSSTSSSSQLMVSTKVMMSPVSPFEFLLARGSPRTPVTPPVPCEVDAEEEERAIAEKGFYLHPSPKSTPRGDGSGPPQLLTLFPLHSPRQVDHPQTQTSSSTTTAT